MPVDLVVALAVVGIQVEACAADHTLSTDDQVIWRQKNANQETSGWWHRCKMWRSLLCPKEEPEQMRPAH